MGANHFQGSKTQAGNAGPHRRARAGATASHGMSADHLLALQSQVGNQATMAMTESNPTSLPDRSTIEAHFGQRADGANVHYKSDQADQLQAMSYAQGTDIHVGPGQEREVPHEAWHVVQQAQGKVKPTSEDGSGNDLQS